MNNDLVMVTGIFNVLHPGHLRLFKFAKSRGQRLVVGVLSDDLAGHAAYVPESLRLEALNTNQLIDEVFIVKNSIAAEIRLRKPAFVVKGKEFEFKQNIETKVLDEYGGKILFSSGDVVFSSTDLIQREFSKPSWQPNEKPSEYLTRRSISRAGLLDLVSKFSALRVLVIGDSIVDEYISCDTLGLSEEDPSIVVSPIESRRFVGGAAIVAAHARSLGCDVTFVSVFGDDEAKVYCENTLASLNLKSRLIVDKTRSTTVKQRYRSKGKTLFRVSHLTQVSINTAIQDEIMGYLQNNYKSFDLVILSDFNYGVLPQRLVDKISALCTEYGILVVADSQSSSQVGDIARFKNMALITPTEREARLALKNFEDGLAILGESLSVISGAKNVIVKLGGDGLLIHVPLENYQAWDTDRIPALNQSPQDVAGAGDCLLVATSLVLSAGGTIWEAAYLGSVAAGIQVGRVGNMPIKQSELIQAIN